MATIRMPVDGVTGFLVAVDAQLGAQRRSCVPELDHSTVGADSKVKELHGRPLDVSDGDSGFET